MTNHDYTGPRIPRTPRTEQQVRVRAMILIDAITVEKYNATVADRATAKGGRFPDLQVLQREAISEVETLCRALDGWGAADPDAILGPGISPEEFLWWRSHHPVSNREFPRRTVGEARP